MTAGEWRTRLPAEFTRQWGVEELHMAVFAPAGDRRKMASCWTAMLPETPVDAIKMKLAEVALVQARMAFICDTREQAEHIAAVVAGALCGYERISLERAEQGAWGLLA